MMPRKVRRRAGDGTSDAASDAPLEQDHSTMVKVQQESETLVAPVAAAVPTADGEEKEKEDAKLKGEEAKSKGEEDEEDERMSGSDEPDLKDETPGAKATRKRRRRSWVHEYFDQASSGADWSCKLCMEQQERENDPDMKVARYAATTSTSSMARHLICKHKISGPNGAPARWAQYMVDEPHQERVAVVIAAGTASGTDAMAVDDGSTTIQVVGDKTSQPFATHNAARPPLNLPKAPIVPKLPARAGKLHNRPSFDPSVGALLVIDVQNYSAVPDRGMNVGKTAANDHYWFSTIDSMTANIKQLLMAFREKKCEIIYTVMESLTKDGRDSSVDYKLSGIHVPKGSSDAEILSIVAPAEDDIILRKTSHSAFNSTNIDYVLRNLGVSHLALTGIVTNQCVEGAMRDAADRGYYCTLVTDATAAHSKHKQSAAEQTLKGFGNLCTTAELLKLLEA